MPATLPRLNGHHTHHHHHDAPPPPRPHVPDPALLIQQFADPGCAQSPLDLAREHGLTLDQLIAFFDHPDTQRTLAGLDRLNARRAASLAAAARPLALQALTQIAAAPAPADAPAARLESIRKAATTLARSRGAGSQPVPPSPLPWHGLPARVSPSSSPHPSPNLSLSPPGATAEPPLGRALPFSFSSSPPPAPSPVGEGRGEGSMASLPPLHSPPLSAAKPHPQGARGAAPGWPSPVV